MLPRKLLSLIINIFTSYLANVFTYLAYKLRQH